MRSRRERKEINMDKPRFVYVVYISTSPEKLWNAVIDPKMTEKYWQHENISDWKPGSKWEHRDCDEKGTLRLQG
jgi:uncharacterized protein YndB with AHSA1/START domain